jgi:UDP-glucose-4-epimerase GalE
MSRIAILVTGGAGYIGSHCCKALYESGYLPVCLDDLSTGHEEFVRWGPLVNASIADRNSVTRAISEFGISAVVHLAASSLVGESVADPQKYYMNNVAGTLALLQTMVEQNCQTIVFSSTGAVYGDAGGGAIREDAAGNPVSPYGVSKWMVERILQDYGRAYGLKAVCLRYFNASGADASGLIGEWRAQETHLIPRAMMALQGQIAELQIFGTDYDTLDGTAIRDYIHVTDLAAAHIAALQKLSTDFPGGSFNLGTGNGFSVRQVLSSIANVTGRIVPTVVRARRDGDPTVIVADPTAARDVLQFRPAYSDLDTIIRSAWNWHQARA